MYETIKNHKAVSIAIVATVAFIVFMHTQTYAAAWTYERLLDVMYTGSDMVGAAIPSLGNWIEHVAIPAICSVIA